MARRASQVAAAGPAAWLSNQAHLQPAQHAVPLRGRVQRRAALLLLLLPLAVAATATPSRERLRGGAAAHQAGRQAVQAGRVHTQRRQLLPEARQGCAWLPRLQRLQESLLQDEKLGLLQWWTFGRVPQTAC